MLSCAVLKIRFTRAYLLSLLFAYAVSGIASAAPQDTEPAKDHPGVPRFPGFVMSGGNATDFNGVDFQIGPENKVTRVEFVKR